MATKERRLPGSQALILYFCRLNQSPHRTAMAHHADDLKIENNEDRQRFEANVDGQTAVLEYKLSEGTISFVHTEVPEELEGQGIGSQLAEAALTYAQKHTLDVLPYCSYVAAYIRRHPEYQSLVKPGFDLGN